MDGSGDGLGENGYGRLIPAGMLARALRTHAAVLSYYEARLAGVRAVAEDGRRHYRRADAMLLAGIVEAVATGDPLADILARASGEGRRALTSAGQSVIDTHFPAASAPAPAQPVPADARVRHRGEASPPTAAEPGPPLGRDKLLRVLSSCVADLQRTADESR